MNLRLGVTSVLVFACIATVVSANESHSDLPSWIWHTQQRGPAQTSQFSKSFSIPGEVTSAVLRCSGDSAGLAASLDGTTIVDIEPFDPITQIDVTDMIRPGEHRLVVSANSVEGPAAFFLQLKVRLVDGSSLKIVSDESWRATGAEGDGTAIEFGAVDPRWVIPQDRQIGIKATDNYEQWKQALGADKGTNPTSFSFADGFEVQLVRSAKAKEDSWVSMAFDSSGRVIIAKESKGLLRMTLSADGDCVSKTELINDSLKECRGVLPVGRDLFINANNSKALYKLPAKGKDNYGDAELIFASSGSVGHGRNDLALDTEGKIYSIHGDAVDLPIFASDHTSPFRDASLGTRSKQGHLLRIDPKTRAVELLATGLRNPFGIDFNTHGDIFTYDADAEYDMGSPWYRPTRVCHLVTGGDHGWRAVTKSWPPYYPDHVDNTRPNLDIGKGSPTAVKFGTRSNFPHRFREALFVLDWAYGRIIAVHTIARGASYVMAAENFLQGRPLNVTDLEFGPGGSMYFVTGGRKTRSALYRVRFVGEAREPSIASPQATERLAFAKESRAIRHNLEDQLLRDPSAHSLNDVWKYLDHPDPWIQQAASNVLERHPVERWADRALKETAISAAVRSLLSLARSKHDRFNGAVVARLNELPIADASRTDKLAALQAYSLCIAHRVTMKESLDATREKLDSIYPDDSYEVNRLLSELLVTLRSEHVIEKTIGLLKRSTSQIHQMHYLYVLRNVDDGWTLEHRRVYFEALAGATRYRGGAGMPVFLKQIRSAAIESLSDEERNSLAGIIKEPTEQSSVEPAEPRPFVRKWTVAAVTSLDPSQHHFDLDRGKQLFRAANCSNCHRIGGHGTLVGPDLTNINRRFSRRDLLTSIIHPSSVIAENYRSLQIVTTDGTVLIGQVGLGGDYRSPALRLATDPQQPLKTVEVLKSEIESQQTSPVSWMPEGLLNTFSASEILDLLAYIESGGR